MSIFWPQMSRTTTKSVNSPTNCRTIQTSVKSISSIVRMLFRDTIEPSDDNQTLALLSTDADASAGSANETGAETSVQVNATHETKVNCTPVNIDVATNQVRHHLASVWNL